jgi:hypothetical protein
MPFNRSIVPAQSDGQPRDRGDIALSVLGVKRRVSMRRGLAVGLWVLARVIGGTHGLDNRSGASVGAWQSRSRLQEEDPQPRAGPDLQAHVRSISRGVRRGHAGAIVV